MSRVAYRYTTMGWLVVSVLVLGAVAGTGAQRAFDALLEQELLRRSRRLRRNREVRQRKGDLPLPALLEPREHILIEPDGELFFRWGKGGGDSINERLIQPGHAGIIHFFLRNSLISFHVAFNRFSPHVCPPF